MRRWRNMSGLLNIFSGFFKICVFKYKTLPHALNMNIHEFKGFKRWLWVVDEEKGLDQKQFIICSAGAEREMMKMDSTSVPSVILCCFIPYPYFIPSPLPHTQIHIHTQPHTIPNPPILHLFFFPPQPKLICRGVSVGNATAVSMTN